MLAIQLSANSVRRETIDIRNEMRENNMTMARQFGLMNRDIRRIALAPGQQGVANKEITISKNCKPLCLWGII
jgi:hypothetical protein